MEIDDLKEIKKYYVENMMHLCRELFPSLLEQEGFLRDSDKKKIEKFYAPKYLKKYQMNINLNF